ncbi:MAG: alpha/beta fold hydrolase [Candidatus Bathyarchaeota archaeon]|nr:alpha/beta fold hydrolase [Candidatus Bathyarchaeota archaeon]
MFDFVLTIVLFAVSAVVVVYVVLCYFLSRTIIHLDRQPVPKTPKDYGMNFQSVTFKAVDGVNLKGWLIPAESDKLVVMTHVGGLTKYGSTKAYKSFSKLFNEEVEFLKVARHLNNAGYGVLMFDFRNHGESDPSPNGGKAGVGLEEFKDVSAAMDYIQGSSDLKDKDVGFVSFCMGANSTIIAMSKNPEKFEKVKCLVAVQPISMEVFVDSYFEKRFTAAGASLLLPTVKRFVNWQSKHRLQDMSPAGFVKDIKVPTLYVQTRNDPWTKPSDIRGFYENTKAPKEFFWLEGLTHRFQGYQYFGDKPEEMLSWLKKWM